MKAVIVTKYGGPDGLLYTDVQMPSINENEVLIKVHGTSVNFADIKARKGVHHLKDELPFIPGLDLTGTVVEVGSNVKTIKVGERVIAFAKSGSYAQYAVATELLTFPISDQIDEKTAAAAPTVLFTSYCLLKKVAQMEKGETVLIHSAAGGVGTTAVQMAKQLGAKTVIGTVSKDEKREIVSEAGADFVLNYQNVDWIEKMKEITDGEGVSVILDPIGGEVRKKSFQCLSPFGKIVNFGNASGKKAEFNGSELYSQCQSILGFSFGKLRRLRPEKVKEIAKEALPFLEKKQIKIFVGDRFPLKDAATAHERMESRKSTGKLLLYP